MSGQVPLLAVLALVLEQLVELLVQVLALALLAAPQPEQAQAQFVPEQELLVPELEPLPAQAQVVPEQVEPLVL